MKTSTLCALIVAVLSVASVEGQIDTAILRPVGYHPSNVTYFNAPYFANALHNGSEWYSFSNFEFGTLIDYNTAQFVNGYPQFLNPGQRLRALVFGLNTNYGSRPAAWPARDTLAKGRIIVTWKGNADIRLVNGTFVATGSSGGMTGSLTDGRRIYLCTGANESTQSIEVHAIGTPLTEIKVWLAAPDDPATQVKENETTSLEGQLFHPLLLQRIADADWGFIRFMDWGWTNASPQQDWADRRLPAHIFQGGILNRREPAPGVEGNRETGVAYEHMIALANATGRNLWINVPHLATADYITRLAKLIRFGSDGVNPFDAPQVNPLHPPLNANLKVYVEFSNEIWSSGFSFPQGNWAEGEATVAGISKARFNARRFCDTWRIFQEVFGGTSRLVRVAAIFTALDSYSRPFMQEIGTYGQTLNPTVRPDVLAVTTYFGNGIQDFVNQQGFTAGKLFNDPYWTSALYATHLTTAFDEWKRRILAGDAAQGSGPDATAIGGGFASTLRTLPNETVGYSLPIIAYEGGPSLFTDTIDQNATNGSGVPTDDHVTTFIEAMNRDARIADVYRIHLDIAKSKGLWTHTPYTDTIFWSRFGQWGHLETLDQTVANSPKYALMLEHFTTFSTIRHIDTPVGAVPQFSTDAILPVGIAGQPYTTDITTSGGTGTRTVTVVGSLLEAGLTVTAGPTAGTLRISGTPSTSRKNFVFARVTDSDNDPAWRIFTLQTFGGAGTLVQSDFRGTSPALALPWTTTFVLSSKVTWSGWNIGAPASGGTGVTPLAGDNALVFGVSAPAAANETLSQAIADNEFLRATVTPVGGPLDLRGAEVRFSTRRIGFHSPLGYALFSSIGGFAEANALYVSSQVNKDNTDETEHIVTLPSTAAFAAINAPLEFRIYAFGAQFDGHATSLTGFKLTEVTVAAPTITTFTPTSGAIGGSVTINGTNFTGATAVRFNGVTATFTVVTSSQITTTVPTGATTGPITVIGPGGTATSASNFTVSTGGPRGDANGDGAVGVSDVFYLINNLFAGGAAPLGTADANGDGVVTVSDVFYMINFLFAGGPPPP